MRRLRIIVSMCLVFMAMTLCKTNVLAAQTTAIELKETKKDTYELVVTGWVEDACAVEVHFTTAGKYENADFEFTDNSNTAYRLMKAKEENGNTTFSVYLSKLTPIAQDDEISLGSFIVKGGDGLKPDQQSASLKTVLEDYTETELNKLPVTVKEAGTTPPDNTKPPETTVPPEDNTSKPEDNTSKPNNPGQGNQNTGSGNNNSSDSKTPESNTASSQAVVNTAGNKGNKGNQSNKDKKATVSVEAQPETETAPDASETVETQEGTPETRETSPEKTETPASGPAQTGEVKESGATVFIILAVVVVVALLGGGFYLYKVRGKKDNQ